MPKATEQSKPKPKPVSAEKFQQEKGVDPYAEARVPVNVPLTGGIQQPVVPSRFPAPEVEVEALCRGVEDRGFTFGRGGKWFTTRKRAQELAGQIRIVKEL